LTRSLARSLAHLLCTHFFSCSALIFFLALHSFFFLALHSPRHHLHRTSGITLRPYARPHITNAFQTHTHTHTHTHTSGIALPPSPQKIMHLRQDYAGQGVRSKYELDSRRQGPLISTHAHAHRERERLAARSYVYSDIQHRWILK